VKAKIQTEKVFKGFPRNLPDGALADIGKNCIQQFTQHSGANPCSAI
jgi:hypothetical protein